MLECCVMHASRIITPPVDLCWVVGNVSSAVSLTSMQPSIACFERDTVENILTGDGIAYAMLCYAMLCYAMLCYAMLCYAMLCYAMLCYAMLCYATLCCAVLCCAVLCCAVLYCAVLKPSSPCRVTPV